MKLTINDRFAIANNLPKNGDIISLRIIRDLHNDLIPSDAELTSALDGQKVVGPDSNSRYMWNVEKAKTYVKDIAIGENARSIIVEVLKDLNAKKQLSFDLIGIYERFVEGKKTAADAEQEAKTKVQKKALEKANADVDLPCKP